MGGHVTAGGASAFELKTSLEKRNLRFDGTVNVPSVGHYAHGDFVFVFIIVAVFRRSVPVPLEEYLRCWRKHLILFPYGIRGHNHRRPERDQRKAHCRIKVLIWM